MSEGTPERVATVARGSSRRPKGAVGPDSRRFYAPLDIYLYEDGSVRIQAQSDKEERVRLWAEEAEELGLALLKASWAAGA